MRGLAQPVIPPGGRVATQRHYGGSCPDPSAPVYGLVIQRNYPDQDAVRALVSASEALWVCAETDLEARRILVDIEHVELPLLPFFRGDTYDVRRMWRDCELLLLCDRVYVYQRTKSQWTTWLERGVYPGLSVVTTPEKARGRNPRRTTYQVA